MPVRSKPLRRQALARRRRPAVRSSRRSRWRARLILATCALVLFCIAWGALARAYAPAGNTQAARFDAIIVLGTTVDRDGNPSPAMLARVTEGVREYERGVAPRILVTGGEEHGFTEAAVMSRIAQAQGVPASSLILEPRAENTIQNACFSARILEQHGWRSAEVVTSPSHLPRAEMIFSAAGIEWHGHAAPPLQPQSAFQIHAAAADEVLHTVYYLVFSRWAESCSP